MIRLVTNDGGPLPPPQTQIVIEELSPEELAAYKARQERFRRNSDWLEAHAAEAFAHRGKFLCIAGEELFVGDDVLEVVARAKAAHPEDDGLFTRYVPVERGPRIYAHRR
jgi:hypothetical protein